MEGHQMEKIPSRKYFLRFILKRRMNVIYTIRHPFQTNVLTLYSLKTAEHQRFSTVFNGWEHWLEIDSCVLGVSVELPKLAENEFCHVFLLS